MKTLLVAGAAVLTAALPTVATELATPILRLESKTAPDATRGKYPPEMVVAGQKAFDGSFVESIAFPSKDGKHFVRIWESGPGILQTDGYPYDEYCLVVEGKLEITNKDGSTAVFVPGDSFVIPKGWQGKWNMKSKFKKQYIALTATEGGAQ